MSFYSLLTTFNLGLPLAKVLFSFISHCFFCTLALSTIYALILLMINKRNQHLKELNYLRTKISSDLHDDVGTLLAGLAMQAELLEHNLSEVNTAKLAHLSEMSRTAMCRMRDLVWSIDNRKDRWSHLVDRLNEHANETLMPLNIDFELKVDGIDPYCYISPDLRQNLYFIGKEAITNVAKHSDAANVTILIRQQNGNYDMHIQDNGQCLAQTPSHPVGLGLSNIKWRAKQLGAKLSFQNSNGFEISLQRIEMG
ncbi:MAG: histidine kinase [Saprospiraceae bacterium]